jgi:Skp family chaperone for outer membrane proteins
MKELFDNLIGIIEQANGVRETMETEIKKYVETNKKALEDASAKIKDKFEDVMKNITQGGANLQEIMQKTIDVMTEFLGKDTVAKLMEIQKKFPFIQEYMKNIMPGRK